MLAAPLAFLLAAVSVAADGGCLDVGTLTMTLDTRDEDGPIHSNPDANFKCPATAATLMPSSGTNTRNPHAALNPIPKQIASAVCMLCLREVRKGQHVIRAAECLIEQRRHAADGDYTSFSGSVASPNLPGRTFILSIMDR